MLQITDNSVLCTGLKAGNVWLGFDPAGDADKTAVVFYGRQTDKTERQRREVMAAKLRAAAARCSDPKMVEVWAAKARACGYWPRSYLRTYVMGPVDFTPDPSPDYVLPAKPVPWISLILWLALAVALT